MTSSARPNVWTSMVLKVSTADAKATGQKPETKACTKTTGFIVNALECATKKCGADMCPKVPESDYENDGLCGDVDSCPKDGKIGEDVRLTET